jgi:hypothetical protein
MRGWGWTDLQEGRPMVQAISRMERVLCFLLSYMNLQKLLGDPVQILKFCVETPPAGTNGVNGLMSDMIDAV